MRLNTNFSHKSRTYSLMSKVMREPIVQFLLIASVLFFANHLINGPENQFSTQLITITKGQVQQISNRYKLVTGHLPTQDELHALLDDFITEEVSYREAIALGLDVDDTIVRRRMKQKLAFLAEDANAGKEPSNTELEDWLKSRPAQYRTPERISFQHVLFSQDLRGDKAESDAAKFLVQLNTGVKHDSIGDPSMIPASLSLMSKKRVAALFGERFATGIFSTTETGWFGPIHSPYGKHLVTVTKHEPSKDPIFNEIQGKLKSDWIEAKREQAAEKFLARIRQRYIIEIDWPDISNQEYLATPNNKNNFTKNL